MKTIKTSSGLITEIEKGVIYFRYDKGIEISVLQMEENFKYLEKYVSKNGKIKLILETPSNTFDSSEGFDYVNEIKYKSKYTKAVALIVSSLAQKLNSKHYHTRVDAEVPAKFFKSFDDALEWIKNV